MRHNGERAPFPEWGSENISRRIDLAVKWGLAGLGIILLLVALSVARGVYTNWLWFDHLGFRSVFTTILVTRIWLFFAGALSFAALLLLNLWVANRFSKGESILPIPAELLRLMRRGVNALVILTVLILSLIFGLVLSSNWETFLLFMNRIPFGVKDSQFNIDISYYVAVLPVLNIIQGWLLGAAITIAIAALLYYMVNFSLRGLNLVISPRILRHMAVLGAFLMVIIAMNHLLDIYELVYSNRGATFGASYADVHAKIPALRLLIAISLVSAGLFVVSVFTGGLRLMGGAFGLWIAAAIVAGSIFPAMFQRLVVAPNEFNREERFINRNIDATRFAYGLDDIRVASYPARGELTSDVIVNNPGTINNIRLWDYRPLQDAYNQLQFIRLYYGFQDVDVDRYVVDGEYRQVMLGARELEPENLPSQAQRWVNRKLQYTHGYGVAMSPVTEYTPEGRPAFFIEDISHQGKFTAEVPLDVPQIYYGENTRDYVIVNSETTEFDHPTEEEEPVYANYQGTGGIKLSSFLRRAAYAWQFTDINVLISNQLTSSSRIQYHRQIQERINTIAPFLKLDRDPYLVVDQGRLWWIQDAYTVTNLWPYSTPFSTPFGEANYIRNSVKVLVDVYNGSLRFFVADPRDPVLRLYQRTFPVLFEPLDNLPPSLRSHIRYPLDLFSIQSRVYLPYHMTDVRIFFNKEDLWSIPSETFLGKTQTVQPYYVIMKLPGEEREEFVLILPFTPANKPNMVAWLAARNDGDFYGEKLALIFPREQIDGPSQVEARIDNDPTISQQFTLWGQIGSKIIRGNLLVIPLDDTIFYVEPIYLQAEGLAFPQLKQVIIADKKSVVMRPTLQEGLVALVGEAPALVSLPTEPSSEGVSLSQTVDLGALQGEVERISEAIESLRKALSLLESALNRLEDQLGGGSQ